MKKTIALIPGDGIGPEVVAEAKMILETVAARYGHEFTFASVLMGGCAYDQTGHPMPEESVQTCLSSDAVLLGAVGGPKWDDLPGHLRPEAALLGIRARLGVYANLRPAVLYPSLASASPLRADIAGKGIDLVVVRELIGGIYFGQRGREQTAQGEAAFDTERYTVSEIERIARVAFELAGKRRGKVTSIDKANVLESSRLWRAVVHEVAADYPEIELGDMLVDNAAMQLVRDPSQFDVIVTSNMFGDILSDEAAMITGSIGILASASLGAGVGLYEPIHGSAPDIAGTGKANPIATILSAAMLLRSAFGLEREAAAVEQAVARVLASGARTADLARPGESVLSTREMGARIAAEI